MCRHFPGTAFTYAPAARPYKLLGSDVYVNMQGEVRLFSGEEWAEDTIVTEAVLSGDMLYWLSDTSEVSRVRRGDKAELFTLSGEAAALTANAAIIWQNGALCRESFGTFGAAYAHTFAHPDTYAGADRDPKAL